MRIDIIRYRTRITEMHIKKKEHVDSIKVTATHNLEIKQCVITPKELLRAYCIGSKTNS